MNDVTRYAKGEIPLAQVLKLDAGDVRRLARYAMYLLEQEQNLSKASLAAQLAAECGPSNYDAQLVHACCLAQQHKSREAVQFYVKAQQLKPQEVRPCVDAGEACLALGDYAQAAVHLKKALQLDREGKTPGGHRAHWLVMRVLSATMQS